jgi:NAD(P)-dependent dehydrogenase (short-subunit alcohol dehydrogenase family)
VTEIQSSRYRIVPIEQYNAQAARGTMLKRPGRAEEVAAAILFLASDDAS